MNLPFQVQREEQLKCNVFHRRDTTKFISICSDLPNSFLTSMAKTQVSFPLSRMQSRYPAHKKTKHSIGEARVALLTNSMLGKTRSLAQDIPSNAISAHGAYLGLSSLCRKFPLIYERKVFTIDPAIAFICLTQQLLFIVSLKTSCGFMVINLLKDSHKFRKLGFFLFDNSGETRFLTSTLSPSQNKSFFFIFSLLWHFH